MGISKGFHSMQIERSAKTLSTLTDIQSGKDSRLAQALVTAIKTRPTFNHPTSNKGAGVPQESILILKDQASLNSLSSL